MVNPGIVTVFDINDIGSFDIQFDMVGETTGNTRIRIRRATKHGEFLTAAAEIAGKLAGMKGNVRNLWHGVGKMISVGERKEGLKISLFLMAFDCDYCIFIGGC